MLEKLNKRILDIMNNSRPSADQRARTSARICSGPVLVEKDGQMVFTREATKTAYGKMYEIFLKAYTKEDA